MLQVNIHPSDYTSLSPFVCSQGLVQQQIDGLQIFIGNTVRASFIIFIPALLLTAAYSQCNTHARMHARTYTHMHACTQTHVPFFSAGVWKLSQTEVIDRRSANQGERTEEESSV